MANKRSNFGQISREEPERDEDYQIDPAQQADETIMAKRKIAKPRARRTPATNGQFSSVPQPSSNPFGALATSNNEKKPTTTTSSNPFAFLGSNNNDKPKESTSEETPSKEIQFRALNEQFQLKISGLVKDSLYENWTNVVDTYLKYAQQIDKGEVKLSESQKTKPEEAKPAGIEKPTTASSEPIELSDDDDEDDEVKIEGPQFMMDKPPTMENSPFNFTNTPSEADKAKQGKGFTFNPGNKPSSTEEASSVNGNGDKKEEKTDTTPAKPSTFSSLGSLSSNPSPSIFSSSSVSESKPTGFSFGSGSDKTSEKKEEEAGKQDSKPFFSFNSNREEKHNPPEESKTSSFSFGSTQEETSATTTKSPFSFGSSESTKPAFSFGSNDSTKPSFSFGSTEKKDDKPAAFSFGSTPDTSKDDSKPAFTFGSTNKSSDTNKEEPSSKPLFSFGSSSTSEDKKEEGETKKPFTFGFSDTANTTNTPTSGPSSIFGKSAEASQDDGKPKFTFGSGDTTWSPEKGIKFGTLGNQNTATTTTNTQTGFSFGSGAASNNDSPFKFSFGGSASAASAQQTSDNNNNNDSSADAGNNDNENGDDGDANNEAQKNLSEKGPGEENEDVVYEKKAKVYEFVDGEYKVHGVGPLRVLVHKENKKGRVLVRAEGSGRIIINVLLRSQINYTVEGKGQVKVIDFKADGKPTTYMLRVKTEEDGQNLRDSLEQNKANA